MLAQHSDYSLRQPQSVMCLLLRKPSVRALTWMRQTPWEARRLLFVVFRNLGFWKLAVHRRANIFGVSAALALHIASTRGHTEAVKALLRSRASVDSKLRSGPSSLHLAAEAGHAKTAVELLEAGKKLGSSLTIQRKSAEDLSTELTFLAFLQGLL
jgi:hypothetical protein